MNQQPTENAAAPGGDDPLLHALIRRRRLEELEIVCRMQDRSWALGLLTPPEQWRVTRSGPVITNYVADATTFHLIATREVPAA